MYVFHFWLYLLTLFTCNLSKNCPISSEFQQSSLGNPKLTDLQLQCMGKVLNFEYLLCILVQFRTKNCPLSIGGIGLLNNKYWKIACLICIRWTFSMFCTIFTSDYQTIFYDESTPLLESLWLLRNSKQLLQGVVQVITPQSSRFDPKY